MSAREIVAKNVRRLMLSSDTLNTQNKLGKAAGISQRTVGYLFEGDPDASPTLDTVERIAKAFGLQAWELCIESGEYPVPESLAGYVYVIRIGEFCKIGKSIDPQSRISRMMLPEKPEVLCTIKSDDNHATEKALHRRFSEFRCHGEWFRLPAEAIAELQGMAA